MKRIFILVAIFAITAGAMAQLKLISGGNVGIGTNNPLEKFQIGDIWTFHNGGNKYIGRNVRYNMSVNPARNERIANGSTSLLSFGDGTISFETAGYGTAGSQINTTGRLILDANGNVGIGTTGTPTQKLQVNGNGHFNGNLGLGYSNPTTRLWVEGNVRISAWTDIIFDWSGINSSPVMYPENSWYLHLGKPDHGIGRIYVHYVNSYLYSSTSDERAKENVAPLENPIDKIKQISGYRYNFKREIFPENLPEEVAASYTKEQIGFLAQEIEKVFPELVTHPEKEEDFCGLNYDGMIPVLLEAIKEQQLQIEHLQAMIYQRGYDITFLLEQIDACCQKNTENSFPQQTPPVDESNGQEDIQNKNIPINENNMPDIEKAKLFQNIPNPFSSNTEIRFEIPENSITAKLLIHDMQGAEIKSYNITVKGAGNIIVQAHELPAGMYMYTLLVNNTIIDTKKMILTK